MKKKKVRPDDYFILDDLTPSKRWEGWGWTAQFGGVAPMEAMVLGSDIRVGERLLWIVDRTGRRVDRFGDNAVVKKTKNGGLGFEDLFETGRVREYKFQPDVFYEVKLPRPEPEMNEFGPVSP